MAKHFTNATNGIGCFDITADGSEAGDVGVGGCGDSFTSRASPILNYAALTPTFPKPIGTAGLYPAKAKYST